MTAKKFTLGRGLGALIEDAETSPRVRPEDIDSFAEIDTASIEVNPYQPRKDFKEDALKELTTSIKELGVIQPITVRKGENGKYQVVAGERRLRASKLAGLTKIPAYILAATEQAMMEMALMENIQRDDLNAIEIALSLNQLMENLKLTQEKLSDRIGKKRSTVSNYIRLLELPAEIQLGVRDLKISMGHARALLSFKDPEMQINVYRDILTEGHSVRKVEEMSKELSSEPEIFTMPVPAEKSDKAKKTGPALPGTLEETRKSLSEQLNVKVEIKVSASGKGKLSIPFTNESDLAEILRKINR